MVGGAAGVSRAGRKSTRSPSAVGCGRGETVHDGSQVSASNIQPSAPASAEVALRGVQEDYLETEEALVLPAIRDSVSERRQLQMARSLLIDEGADNPRWINDWVASELDPAERQQLAQREARFQRLTD